MPLVRLDDLFPALLLLQLRPDVPLALEIGELLLQLHEALQSLRGEITILDGCRDRTTRLRLVRAVGETTACGECIDICPADAVVLKPRSIKEAL
jgi:ferredoxin